MSNYNSPLARSFFSHWESFVYNNIYYFILSHILTLFVGDYWSSAYCRSYARNGHKFTPKDSKFVIYYNTDKTVSLLYYSTNRVPLLIGLWAMKKNFVRKELRNHWFIFSTLIGPLFCILRIMKATPMSPVMTSCQLILQQKTTTFLFFLLY